MSVDPVQPARLLVSTGAGPVEVAAAAHVAAAEASDVFSAEVREEHSDAGGTCFVVTPPLAHAPALRLHVTWVPVAGAVADEVGGPRWSVALDVYVVDASACADRARRTGRAVDRFTEVLTQQLTR